MALATPVLTHRMALSFAARAQGLTLQEVIDDVSRHVGRIEEAA